MSHEGTAGREVITRGRATRGNGAPTTEQSGAAAAAEVERLRADLAAARAEIVRLEEENRRLRAVPVEPAVPEPGRAGAHR